MSKSLRFVITASDYECTSIVELINDSADSFFWDYQDNCGYVDFYNYKSLESFCEEYAERLMNIEFLKECLQQ